MITPRISVVTPSYNQGRFIERTIKSVLSQDIDGLEYIVIDAASTDETVSILKRYEDRLSWASEEDRGHSDGINKGILRSSGPIIGWLNSDDIYFPGALKTVLGYFDAHPEVEIVYGDAYHIDEDDGFIERYPTEDWSWERLKDTCFISQPATLLRRRVFDEHGPLDVTLRQSMDYEYWLRLGKRGVRFAHIPEVLAATRLHGEAFTIAERVACHRAVNDITKRHLGRTPDQAIFNYAHAVLDARGLQRTKRLRFAVAVSTLSIYASLRWNKRVSRHVLRTLSRWIIGNARRRFREVFVR